METLSGHRLGVTLRLLPVPVGEDGFVRISDHEDCPPSELINVIFISSSVVSLLQDGCPVHKICSLSEVSGVEDGFVIEDGAREDPGGGLQEVPDPGVAGARVGDESPGGKTVAHHEPGPVLTALGV